MDKCTAHNGTYSCQLPAGHSARHANYKPIVTGRNVRTGTLITTFADNYSACRQVRSSNIIK